MLVFKNEPPARNRLMRNNTAVLQRDYHSTFVSRLGRRVKLCPNSEYLAQTSSKLTTLFLCLMALHPLHSLDMAHRGRVLPLYKFRTAARQLRSCGKSTLPFGMLDLSCATAFGVLRRLPNESLQETPMKVISGCVVHKAYFRLRLSAGLVLENHIVVPSPFYTK